MNYFKPFLFTIIIALFITPVAHSQVEDCTFIPSLWKFGYRDRNNNLLEEKNNAVSESITDAFEVVLSNERWFKEGIINRSRVQDLLHKRKLEGELTDSDKGQLSKASNAFIDGYYTLDSRTENGAILPFYTVYVEVQGFDGKIYCKQYETLTANELGDPATRETKMKNLVSKIVGRLEDYCGEAPPPPPPPPMDKMMYIALSKAEELGHFIRDIANKEIDDHKKTGLIELALDLFYKRSCQIEVSSKNRSTTSYPISEYLGRLRRLGYSKIDLNWINIGIIGKLEPMEDNSNIYKGIIEVKQVFKGYKKTPLVSIGLDGVHQIIDKDLISYEDITTKTLEVYVKINRTQIDKNEQFNFEVLFCEMKVSHTR